LILAWRTIHPEQSDMDEIKRLTREQAGLDAT